MIANIDGGSRGNPGLAGYGVLIEYPPGVVTELCGQLPGEATNNQAEYHALIKALEWAVSRKVTNALIRSDSKLVVMQMLGKWSVRDRELIELWRIAQRLSQDIGAVAYLHVPREENRGADRLANAGMDGVTLRGEQT